MARALGDRFDPALRKRIASGVVLASVAVVLGGWFFASLVLAAVVLMAVEWARLAPLPDPLAQTVPLTALVAAVPSAAVVAVMAERLELAAVILAMGAIAGGALATVLIRVPMDRTAGGILYLGLPAAALVLLRNDPASGLPNVLWLFAVVWATDVCAYAVGRSIGGPRLAPAISPGKTIAGLLGGMAGAAR
jgi:phosphatidate cytidylyltransferase